MYKVTKEVQGIGKGTMPLLEKTQGGWLEIELSVGTLQDCLEHAQLYVGENFRVYVRQFKQHYKMHYHRIEG